MEIVDTAPQWPAQCLVTANSSGPFVDLNHRLPDGESVYLHVDVVRSMFELFDVVDRSVLLDEQFKVRELEHALGIERRRVEALEQSTSALLATKRSSAEQIIVKEHREFLDKGQCRHCGKFASNKGVQFAESPKSLVSHERMCFENPDRLKSVLERS